MTGACTFGAGGGAVGWAGFVSGDSATRGSGTGVGIGAAGASIFGGDATLGGGGGDDVEAGGGELVLQLLNRSRSLAMESR